MLQGDGGLNNITGTPVLSVPGGVWGAWQVEGFLDPCCSVPVSSVSPPSLTPVQWIFSLHVEQITCRVFIYFSMYHFIADIKHCYVIKFIVHYVSLYNLGSSSTVI